jgi:hypothetical protein
MATRSSGMNRPDISMEHRRLDGRQVSATITDDGVRSTARQTWMMISRGSAKRGDLAAGRDRTRIAPAGLDEAHDIGDVLMGQEPVIGRHGEGGWRCLCCRQRAPGQDDIDGRRRVRCLQQRIAGERRGTPAHSPCRRCGGSRCSDRHRSGPVRRCITVEQRLCGGACHTPRSLTMQEKALSSSDGKASATTLRPASVNSFAMIAPVQPNPTMTASVWGIARSAMGSAFRGTEGGWRERVFSAVLLDPIHVVGAGTWKIDHAPGRHALVAAMHGIAEITLMRVLPELVEKR